MRKIISGLFVFLLIVPFLCSCSSFATVLIDVIDIGKADSILIQIGTKTVIIDTDGEEDVPDIIEDYISSAYCICAAVCKAVCQPIQCIYVR